MFFHILFFMFTGGCFTFWRIIDSSHWLHCICFRPCFIISSLCFGTHKKVICCFFFFFFFFFFKYILICKFLFYLNDLRLDFSMLDLWLIFCTELTVNKRFYQKINICCIKELVFVLIFHEASYLLMYIYIYNV